MKTAFIAGFGPIVPDMDESYPFWHDGLGIELEGDPGYWHTDTLDGAKAFALWPLSAAAEATFGGKSWPSDIPTPQAWIELDVDSVEAVRAAVEELERGGHRILKGEHEEPWGQTTSRLLSPEGLLVGVTFTPWMHEAASEGPITES